MAYILGSNLISSKQVRISLTKIFGIGRNKAIRICDQLGLSGNRKVAQLTRIQIDRITRIIIQSDLIDSELQRLIHKDIKRLIKIGCYRGFRHKMGLPLRGQRTHTNANTCRKLKLRKIY